MAGALIHTESSRARTLFSLDPKAATFDGAGEGCLIRPAEEPLDSVEGLTAILENRRDSASGHHQSIE